MAIFDCPAAGLKPLNYFYKKALENKFGFIQSIDQLTMKTLIEPSSVVIKPTIKSSDISTIIKWAGSKKSIVDTLFENFPSEFTDYYEPFLGTAVVFMEAKNRGIFSNTTNYYLNDSLFPLINTYESVRDHYELVIKEFSSKKYVYDKEVFTTKKVRFNQLKKAVLTPEEKIELACLFIYLNKTGFNGMYRENSSGEYNIPFGRYTNPCIYKEEDIKKLAGCLQNESLKITCFPYQDVVKHAKKGDFVYMDPPYAETFSSYSKDSFKKEDQIKLKESFDDLTKRGVKVMESNSSCPFILDLYKDYKIIKVAVKRPINSKSTKRKDEVQEVLIVNY